MTPRRSATTRVTRVGIAILVMVSVQWPGLAQTTGAPIPPAFHAEADRIASIASADRWSGWNVEGDVWFYGTLPDRPQRVLVGQIPVFDADLSTLHFVFTPSVVWPEAVLDTAVDVEAGRLYVVTRPMLLDRADTDLPPPPPEIARKRAILVAKERERRPRIDAPGILRVFDVSVMPSRPMDPPSGPRALPLPAPPLAVTAASGGVAVLLEGCRVFFVHDAAGVRAEGEFRETALLELPFEATSIEARGDWTILVRGQDTAVVSFRNPDRPRVDVIGGRTTGPAREAQSLISRRSNAAQVSTVRTSDSR